MNILIIIIVIFITLLLIFWTTRNYERFCETEECQADVDTIKHLKNVLKNIAPEVTNYDIKPGTESVTINKEKIFICLRDPDNGQMYPFDILLYVTLHELAHVLSKTYSTKTHNLEFRNNFDKLLKRAYEKNFLPVNVTIPDNYCKKKTIIDFFVPSHLFD